MVEEVDTGTEEIIAAELLAAAMNATVAGDADKDTALEAEGLQISS